VITACSDGMIRVFTKDKGKKASEAEIMEFENQAKINKVSKAQGGVSQSEFTNIPDVSEIQSVPGKKEGEIKIVSENGLPVAYSWSVAENR